MTKTRIQALADFKRLFDKLSYGHDYSTTFSGFLDFLLYQLSPLSIDSMKDELERLEKTFRPEMASVMVEMFQNWAIASDDDGSGFYDALGDLFMECVSFGRNGQFFTPQEICDMMAQLNIGTENIEGKSICDPACGSGRTLLAAAKINRKAVFYGADNDITCVKMATINLMVNCMKGEIAWMDTLRMDHYRSYHVSVYNIGGTYLPFLTITGANQTKFIERLSNSILHNESTIETNQLTPVDLKATTINKPQQLFLFD